MYYASEVKCSLDKGVDIENGEVDMRLSKIKPVNSKWLVEATDQLSNDTKLIARAFDKAGIQLDKVIVTVFKSFTIELIYLKF